MGKTKIIVFGGGISGLTCSYLLLKKGYDVTIIEKNDDVGGYCSTYLKDNTYIDTCIHYLAGLRKSELTNLYSELGFTDNCKVIKYPFFYKFYYKNQVIEINRDFGKFKKQLESLTYKEDKKELNNFFKYIKSLTNFPIKTKKAIKDMNFFDYLVLIIKKGKSIKTFIKTKKISIYDYANKFKTPIIKEFIQSMIPNNSGLFPFIGILSYFFNSNADTINIPSKQVVENIKSKIINLGGKIIVNEEITKLNINENTLTSICSKDKEYKGDYYVSGLPLTYLYTSLLDKKFHIEKIDKSLFDYKNNNPISAVLCIYKIKDNKERIDNYFIRYVEGGFRCINSINRSIGFKYYDYITNLDKSHTLICIIDQNIDDFNIWKNMSEEEYNKAKNNICEKAKEVLLEVYPNLKDDINIVEVLTPLSLYKRTYNFGGSYMSSLYSNSNTRDSYDFDNTGIKNLCFCSMWMSCLGGMPSAITNGQFAANALIKKIKKDKKN